MDFLVDMEICFPPDTDPTLLADITQRERAHAARISTKGHFFKEAWIVPCRPARILICTAADATELHATFASAPAFPWSKLEATPLVACDIGTSICISR